MKFLLEFLNRAVCIATERSCVVPVLPIVLSCNGSGKCEKIQW